MNYRDKFDHLGNPVYRSDNAAAHRVAQRLCLGIALACLCGLAWIRT